MVGIFIKHVTSVALIAGCVFATAAPASAEIQKLKVASTQKEIFDNLPFFVASKLGIFKKHDLDVRLTHFNGGGAVVRAVAGGADEIGMVGTSAAIIAAARGVPIKIVSAWTAPSYAIVFVVPKNSSIKTVADLKGKRVGFSRPGSVSETGLLAALRAKGVKANLIPVGSPGNGWAMLKAGRLDATWDAAPYDFSLIDQGKVKVLFDISKYLKNYQQGSLAATTAAIAKDGPKLKRFIAAIKEADAFIKSKPTEAAQIGSSVMGVSEKHMRAMLQNMPKNFFEIGPVSKENFSGSLTEAKAAGGLKQAPTYGAVTDVTLLPSQ